MPMSKNKTLTIYKTTGMGPTILLQGELIRPSEYREFDNRYGVGDYVTRDGTDVHIVISLNDKRADAGEFQCVIEPAIYEGTDEPWIKKGEIETNLTRRYDPIEYTVPVTPPEMPK